MVVASLDTPAVAGSSRTSTTRLAEDTHEVRGQRQRQLRPALEVERVREEHLSESRGQVRRGRRSLAPRRSRRPSRFSRRRSGDTRGARRRALDHPARARRSSSTVAGAEPLLPALLDLAEQRRRDLLHLLADGRGADEPLGLERPSAAPPVPLRLRRSTGRLGADEHVAPSLHAAERESVRDFGIPDASGQLANGDAVPTKRRKFDHMTIEMGSRGRGLP